MKTKNIIIFKSDRELIKIINNIFERFNKNKIDIALTGGNSWKNLYPKLFKQNVLKRKYNYYLTDERYTESKSLQNFFFLKKIFKNKIKIQKFYSFRSIKKSLFNYKKVLPKKMDVVFSSMGIDGHVYSWFNVDKVWIKKNKVSFVNKKSLQIGGRLTLNKNYVNKSRIIFLIIKKNKKNLFKKLKSKKSLPINQLNPTHIFIEK